MFQPKRTKYRKQQKGRNTGNAQRGATLSFGTFGLKATQRGQLTSRQIEACLLYTSPSPRDVEESRMPSSA